MKETDIAWAAGFFEGEGNLSLSTNGAGGFMGMVQVGQKSREPLDRLQKLFGGTVGYWRSSYVWAWYLCSKKALPFLETIEPYITPGHPKQEDIKVYKKFYEDADHDKRMEIMKWWVGRIARRNNKKQGGK